VIICGARRRRPVEVIAPTAVVTNAVVAICVVLVPPVAVGASGVPVRVGLAESTTEPVPVDAVTPVPPLATGSVPVTPVVKGSPVVFVRVPEAGVPRIGAVKVGVVRVGDVANTTDPVPVAVEKSVRPASQDAAVVPDARMHVAIAVVPGNTVIRRFPPELLIVRFPVELLTR